jgi:hypothetical protein
MNKETAALLWPFVVFGATALVLVGLFVKLFQLDDAPAALVIAIAAVAGLLILSPRVFDLIELSVSNTGLTAKIRDVEKKVEEAKQKVEEAGHKIDQLFAQTMSTEMFENLRKISSGNFGKYSTENSGLLRELRHLRDVGYIEVEGTLGSLPREGDDLSRHVRVTPVGKEFVALRESLEEKK